MMQKKSLTKQQRVRVRFGWAVLFLLFCGGSPIPEFLIWRWRVGHQMGRTEGEVRKQLGKPFRTLQKGDPPSAFIHYSPLQTSPPEPRVLIYGFMNERALLYVSPELRITRVEVLGLPSQVADH